MEEQINLNDDGKLQRNIQLMLSGGMFMSNSLLFFSKLGETKFPYLFLFLSICLLGFFLFYLLKTNGKNEIKINEISYFKTSKVFFMSFRYLKLKSGKIRIINFKRNSKELEILLHLLKNANVEIK